LKRIGKAPERGADEVLVVASVAKAAEGKRERSGGMVARDMDLAAAVGSTGEGEESSGLHVVVGE
jgi:hypothetical protein